MSFSPLLDELIDALTILPGVGKKSAQRMAFQLLDRHRADAVRLADNLRKAMDAVQRCARCRTYTENELCRICSDPDRDQTTICVVESPADMHAIESLGVFSGVYFVLMGHLSPIQGLGPDEIGIPQLVEQIRTNACSELVLATNSTMEGEATAHYLSDVLKNDAVVITRLAQGMPAGGELGYLDGSTLTHAFAGRKPFQ